MSDNQDKQNANGSYKYWLSLEQWRKDPDFQKLAESEFMSSPLKEDESSQGGWARREFLKLMGASMALSSFGCIRRPAQKIVPYSKRPSEIIEGLPNFYASSFKDGSEGFGILVKTREGRPIHIEGNKLHPINEGGMSARATADILGLYDPNRLTGPIRNLQNEERTNHDTISTEYAQADDIIAKELNNSNWALLTSSIVSPSQEKLVKDFSSAHKVNHLVWEPMGAEHLRAGQEKSYGQGIVPRFRPDKAKYILSVNSDFLGTYLSPTEAQRLFAKSRKLNKDISKLVAVESNLSFTGTNADERFRIRPSQSADFLAGLLNILIVKKRRSSFAGNSLAILPLQDYGSIHEELGLSAEVMEKIAEELWTHRGSSLVIAGEDYRAQVAANILNSVLGNDGTTIDYRRAHTGYQGSTKDLQALINGLNSGSIERVIIHGVNPVYATADSFGLKEALKKAKLVLYTGGYNDETGQISDFVFPNHHQLENWGDLESQKGVVSIQQPTIQPLGNTRGFEDTLISLSKAAGSSRFANVESWYDYLREQWKSKLSGSFEDAWVKVLQEGVIDNSSDGNASSRSLSSSSFAILKRKQQPKSDLELVLYPTIGLGDGTMANIPWLQEFPDPVTKICWDNYVCVSPKLAKDKNISQGQVVELEVGNTKITVPAHIQPGMNDGTLALAIGYGRTAAGDVGNGVGVNAYKLASIIDERISYTALPALMKVTPTFIPLANVAGHNSMEGRQIVVEATFDEYKKNPAANIHKHKIFSSWSGHKYTSYKWGMTVDLNTCTGCSACVIACQSENNIPTVGKKYVLQGREMHWMRIDRYYVGQPDSPDTVHMPVMCQHCDNAPCETVCPVLATVHSDEGTNDMIYNRCVGTRYCANNCPYKVRRFNWFNYSKIQSPKNLALNPEVTVRSRGVMEKCTFCVHRIHQAKMKAKLEDRLLTDGEVETACQTACPTKAITFGDVNNPNSLVSQSLKDGRSYALLEEVNAAPAVKYQTKIRNTDHLEGRRHHGDKDHSKQNSKSGGHA